MKKLGFIPIPFPDELLYSVFARLQALALYDSPSKLSFDLFGKKNVPATIDLPSHLYFFHQATTEIFPFSENEIINKFTLWPYYSQFLHSSKRESVLSLMKSDNGTGIHNMVGINPSAMIKKKYLRYCPLCIGEDSQKYDNFFWHRAHQIPEMLLCPIHLCDLNSYIPKASEEARSYFIDANNVLNLNNEIHYENDKRLTELNLLMASVLENKIIIEDQREQYLEILKRVFNRGSVINQKHFVNRFIAYYGEDLLSKLLPNHGYFWIESIVRRPYHYFHPVRHLLLINFLNSLKPQPNSNQNPFGNGPWICINKASQHYNQYVIGTFSKHFDSKTKRYIGRFTCTCGMIYTKSFIATADNEKIEFIRVLNWGHEWEVRLKEELSNDKSFRSIALQLGTDAKTISKYAKAQGTVVGNNGNRAMIVKKRSRWKRLFKKYGAKMARTCKPALYAWLYRNDRVWLLVNNQMQSRRKGTPELRLDWKDLDKKVYDLIIWAIKKLKAEKYKGRITKSLVSKIIRSQHFLLGKHSSKLPLSSSLLESQIESNDQFAIRRIRNVKFELKDQSSKLWKVMRKAGLNKKELTHNVKEELAKRYLYG